jgi:hypothetical protein
MKKMVAVVIACAVIAAYGSAGYAEEQKVVRPDAKPAPMGKLERMPQMGGMPMMGMMRSKAEMQTFPDGTIVVMKNDKLYRYDKDLNLVKEVALPATEMKMQPGMACPLCGQKIPEPAAKK